jgi:hypothetical protein
MSLSGSTLVGGDGARERVEHGKPWSSTMCFAWFVWDKSYEDNPTIRWI